MEEVHLFCAQDNHAATDRGGRNRWALQKNQAPKHPRADNYDMLQLSTNPKADQAAVYWQKALRDGTQAPHYVGGCAAFVKGPQNANTLLYNLQHDTLMGFYGTGAEAPYSGGVSAKDTKIFSVPQPFYPASLGYKLLKDLPGGSLSKLRLAVWEGCYTALTASDPGSNFGNLVDGTVAKGAKCAVGFTGFIYLTDHDQNGVANYPYEIWAGNFWQALSQGKTSGALPDGNPRNVGDAVGYANIQVLNQCRKSEGFDSFRAAGDITTKIAPIQQRKTKMAGLFSQMSLLFSTAFLVSLAAQTEASPSNVSGAPVSALDTAERSSVARVLSPDTRYNFRREAERRGRASVNLAGPSFDADMDKETGLLTGFTLENRHIGNLSGSPALTLEKALANASAFVGRAGLSLNGTWTLTQEKYLDHGSAGREYSLQWTRLFQGIELPSLIDVHVDADTGEVYSYLLIDDPVTISIQVNLTRQEAIQAIINKVKWQHPDVRAADLSIWYIGGYPGRQALLWRLEMANPDATTGKDSYVWADVDAATGQVYSLGKPGGFVKMKPNAKAQGEAVPMPKIDMEAIRKDKVPPTVFQLAKRKKAK